MNPTLDIHVSKYVLLICFFETDWENVRKDNDGIVECTFIMSITLIMKHILRYIFTNLCQFDDNNDKMLMRIDSSTK